MLQPSGADDPGFPRAIGGADSRRLDLLWRASKRLAQVDLDARAAADELAHILAGELAELCMVTLRDPDGHQTVIAARAADRQLGMLLEAYAAAPDAPALTAFLPASGEAVVVPRVEAGGRTVHTIMAAPPWRDLFAARSAVLVPLRAGGEVLGALYCARHASPEPFVRLDVEVVQALADRAALALLGARAEARARADERRLALLAEVGVMLSHTSTLDETLAAIASVGAGALADWCMVDLVTGNDLRRCAIEHTTAAGRAVAAKLLGRFAIAAPGGAEDLARARGIVLLSRAGDPPPFSEPEQPLVRILGCESLLVVPLRASDSILGVVVLGRGASLPAFEPHDCELAAEIGRRAGLAVRRIGLVEEAQAAEHRASKQARKLQALVQASRAIAASGLDLTEILDVVTRKTADLVGDACVLMLLDDEHPGLHPVSAAHRDATVEAELRDVFAREPTPVTGGLADLALATGQAILLTRHDDILAHAMPRFRGFYERHDVASVVVAPLTARGRLLGTITMMRSSERPPYDADSEAFLVELADRAALAIENAQLNRAESGARRSAEDAAGRALRELAERREIERRLADADRRKDEFLAMLAHELRNPLAPVQLAVQVLKAGDANPARIERCHEIIARQTHLLGRLLDDLLDVSRITRGTVELRKQALSVAAVVGRAVDAVRMQIERARHELVVSIPPTPLTVLADPVRLEQVLVNLLTNAAKYTDEGGRIEVSVARAGAMVEIGVRDNGIGIAPEMLRRVFDMFVQGDRGLARTQGGLGIGLTVVRHLVELHGGSVEALSEGPGRGTEMIVRLPLVEAPPDESRRSAARRAGAPGRRVLVVDDNRDIVEMLCGVLHDWGHDVRAASEGPRALEIARTFDPELVVLDIGLPGMDGYELVGEMQRCLGPGRCYVALTGYGQERDRERTRLAGFDHHLVKPLGLDELAEIVAAVDAPPAPAKG